MSQFFLIAGFDSFFPWLLLGARGGKAGAIALLVLYIFVGLAVYALCRWINALDKSRRQAAIPTIVLDDFGFAIIEKSRVVSRVDWTNVVAIRTFKVDLFVVDTIRLAFDLDDGMTQQIDEDWRGFKEFVACVESKYNIATGWWTRVAFPAFATNEATLWTRESTAHTEQ